MKTFVRPKYKVWSINMENSFNKYRYLWWSVSCLVGREFVRFFMEPSRVVGIVLQPLLFLTVFGVGFQQSFFWQVDKNVSYAAFFFPGILALTVLFGAIYSTLTLVEDKKLGFFRLALIAPGGVQGALLGKLLATVLMSFSQALLFLPLIFVLQLHVTLLGFAQILIALWFGSVCCGLLGLLFAWLSPSSSAFHALMSVILIPLWLLSGAMFPLSNSVLKMLALANPVSYLVDAIRASFFGVGSFGNNLALLFGFSVLLGILVFRVGARGLK